MNLLAVSDGYYLTLNREPYTPRTKTFISEFKCFYGFDKTYAGKHCHLWKLGEMKFVYANSYSHYLLYKHLSTISWKSQFMFICEDDAVFYADWQTKWNKCVPYIPYDAELIYLHHHPSHEKNFGTHIGMYINESIGTPIGPFSTTSYAITKQCVFKLINLFEKDNIYRSFDSILNTERKTFKIYSLVNSICYENKDEYKSERLT